MATRRDYVKAEELIGRERTIFDPNILEFVAMYIGPMTGRMSPWHALPVKRKTPKPEPVYTSREIEARAAQAFEKMLAAL